MDRQLFEWKLGVERICSAAAPDYREAARLAADIARASGEAVIANGVGWDPWSASDEAIHSSSFRDGAPAPDLRCAIAHRGISRSRARCFASPRNDGDWIASLRSQ